MGAGGVEEGQGGWGKHRTREAGEAHQVTTDPGIDKAEGQHSKLEELGTAVVCQEAQAA